MPLLLGIDLGGTAVKLGICDERGRVKDSASIPTRARLGPRAVVDDMAAAARRLKGFAAARSVGIGAPGPLDVRRTRVLVAPNLGWKDVPLPRLLSRALGRPVRLENDANCAAVAEAQAGAGRGASSLALYTLGTGVGGGLVVDGRLWAGAAGGAGEFGHMTIDPRGPACPCGRRGCLEALASATAVARAAGAPDARTAFAMKSARARKAVRIAAEALGSGIAMVFNAIQPERFVLAGGMALAGPGFLTAVRRAAADRIFAAYRRNLDIVLATLGTDAGWIGAAMVAKEMR
ncbi:MAG TPA: ROK family protein [Planctomycetota bacterium]|nr:ROK family protein [Planctomycetota bacterium]